MARGEPPGSGPPLRERAPLPAPYRSPWRSLIEALLAVTADLRLSLQRLWRRNREADLPLPPVWPRPLAPLFWPLLLVATLVLLAGLAGWLLSSAGAAQTSVDDSTGSMGTLSAATESRPTAASPQVGATSGGGPIAPSGAARTRGMAAAGAGEREAPSPGATDALSPRPGGSGRPAIQTGVPTPPPGAAEPTGPEAVTGQSPGSAPMAELSLDPLLELLGPGEDAGLLKAARPDPSGARLILTLSPAAEALPQAELQQRAQRWQRRARDAGYERLELRDSEGRLRGREALVGSGMILLAPVPGS